MSFQCICAASNKILFFLPIPGVSDPGAGRGHDAAAAVRGGRPGQQQGGAVPAGRAAPAGLDALQVM